MARRRFFRGRRRVARRPSRFAPARAGYGRYRSWEQLQITPIFEFPDTKLPFVFDSPAGVTTRGVPLLPQNLVRGVVTLLRMRGHIAVHFSTATALDVGGYYAETIQLIPTRGGDISTASALNPTNAADLESDAIIWRRTCTARQGTGPGLVAFLDSRPMMIDDFDIRGIKSKRTFDRAQYALWYVASFQDVDAANILLSFDMRALFATSEGA